MWYWSLLWSEASGNLESYLVGYHGLHAEKSRKKKERKEREKRERKEKKEMSRKVGKQKKHTHTRNKQ